MLLSVSKLSKSYDKKYAIKDINFNIKKGEIVGLVGENGAGKTSTIKSILKLIFHDTGVTKFEKEEYSNFFDIENDYAFKQRIYLSLLFIDGIVDHQNILIVSHSHVFKAISQNSLFLTDKKTISNCEYSRISRL